jgi:hypothetical protein
VTLNLDASAPLRSLPRLEELVRAVFRAPASTQEMHWVEWKSEGDAAEGRWRARLAKQVLGMANRDPDAAAAWFGGCGYVLVGVEPGALNGTPVHDSAKLESWLAPYVGRTPNGPEWVSAYPEVDGKRVLVLIVEPPRPGQGAWPCRRTFAPDPRTGDASVRLRDGAIYVRHKASTQEADSADVEMLTRRASGTRRRIAGVCVLLAPESHAGALDAYEETISGWAERERTALEPPPPPPAKPAKPEQGETQTVNIGDLPPGTSLRATAKMLADLSSTLNGPFMRSMTDAFYEADKRTREDYDKQVDGYIAKAMKAMPAFILRKSIERGLGRLALFVRNDTEDPIRQLQVDLYIAADGVQAFYDSDAPDIDLPKRPVMLGHGGRSKLPYSGGASLAGLRAPNYDYLSGSIQPLGRGVKIDNSGSVRVTFDPVDLFPLETVGLAEINLLARTDLAGTNLTTQWTARSRDASGVLSGTLGIPVDPHMPTIEELAADSEAPAGEWGGETDDK